MSSPRPISISLLFLLLASISLSSCSQPEDSNLDDTFNIGDYAGKWLIINYWAIWCGPCAKEMPELNDLQREYKDQLTVLGVNYDKKIGEDLLADIRAIGMEFDYIERNPADVLKLSRPEGLPVTYLFSPQGKLEAKLVGPQTKAALLTRIERLTTELTKTDTDKTSKPN